MTAGSDGFGGSGGTSEYGEPVFRDKRRIDPETGQVREPQPSGRAPSTAPGPDTARAPGDATAGGSDVTAKLEAELAERTSDLQRLQAEYVNYKRRVDRDRQVVRDTAVASVLTALLPVLDDIGRARDHDELTGGFKAVAESFERTVAGLGLEKFGEVGDPFDPRIHEALMHKYSDDVNEPVAEAVLQVGYRFGERVIRPARVSVVEPSAPYEVAGAAGMGTASDNTGEGAVPGEGAAPPAGGTAADPAADEGAAPGEADAPPAGGTEADPEGQPPRTAYHDGNGATAGDDRNQAVEPD